MSGSDRDKWNDRYRRGAYRERRHPSVLVKEYVPDIFASQQNSGAELRALDLACGAGRNALYLARLGYRVDALDVSSEALARAEQAARAEALPISCVVHDLDHGLPRGLRDYDLILIMRYLDLSLVASVVERLSPGGYLICEAHLASAEPVIGPRDAAFRAQPGELRAAATGLDIAEYWEGSTQDPDGRAVALARLVARRQS